MTTTWPALGAIRRIVASKPAAHSSSSFGYPADALTSSRSGCSAAINDTAWSRQIGHVRASVAVGIDTAAVGQPPLIITISSDLMIVGDLLDRGEPLGRM